MLLWKEMTWNNTSGVMERVEANSDDVDVCELMGLRAGITLPRTEAFAVNSKEVSVWELMGLRAGITLPRNRSVLAPSAMISPSGSPLSWICGHNMGVNWCPALVLF